MRLELGEAELVMRAASGEAEAFRALVQPHMQAMFQTAVALVGRDRDAEDVVQETLLAAFAAMRGFRGRSAFRTWLWGILLRQASLARRRGRLRRIRMMQAGARVGEAEAGGQARADARMDVAGLLQRLTPEHREVLVLREMQQMSYEEIAVTLGVPKGTVESRLFRARSEFRSLMMEGGKRHG